MESVLSLAYSLMDRLLPLAFAEPAFMKRALLAVLFVAPAAAAVESADPVPDGVLFGRHRALGLHGGGAGVLPGSTLS
jgi:hypothetical protein